MVLEAIRGLHNPQIPQNQKDILSESGFVTERFTGRSIRDMKEGGLPIVTIGLRDEDSVLDIQSMDSEFAYSPTGLYLPDSYRNSSYDQQALLLKTLEDELLSLGLKDISVIFPSAADALELAEIELKKGNRIFGRDYGYIYTRTSNEVSPDSTLIVGCDDLDSLDMTEEEEKYGPPDDRYRGIHILEHPKDDIKHSGLYVIPILVSVAQ